MHMAQLMPLPLTVSAPVKSRLVLPFWYWLTWAVLDKGPLNRCCDGIENAHVSCKIQNECPLSRRRRYGTSILVFVRFNPQVCPKQISVDRNPALPLLYASTSPAYLHSYRSLWCWKWPSFPTLSSCRSFSSFVLVVLVTGGHSRCRNCCPTQPTS